MQILHHTSSHLLCLIDSSDPILDGLSTNKENEKPNPYLLQYRQVDGWQNDLEESFPRLVKSEKIETTIVLDGSTIARKHGEYFTHGTCIHTNEKRETRQFLILGSNIGIIRFLDFKGRTIFEEKWQNAPVLSTNVSTDYITITYVNKIVVISKMDLIKEMKKGNFEEADLPAPIYHIFNVSGQGKVSKAFMLSKKLYGLDSLDMLQFIRQYEITNEEEHQKHVTESFKYLLCVGEKPCIATYMLDEHYTNLSGESSMFSATKLASKYANKLSTSLVSAISYFSRKGNPNDTNTTGNEDEISSKASKITKANVIEPAYYFDDAPREIRSLQVEEQNYSFAVCEDMIGRVLLFEPLSLRLIHIFKGYRDAHSKLFWYANELYLLLYAPLRGLVEIWSIPSINRVEAFHIERYSSFIDVEVSKDSNDPEGSEITFIIFSHPDSTQLFNIQWKIAT